MNPIRAKSGTESVAFCHLRGIKRICRCESHYAGIMCRCRVGQIGVYVPLSNRVSTQRYFLALLLPQKATAPQGSRNNREILEERGAEAWAAVSYFRRSPQDFLDS